MFGKEKIHSNHPPAGVQPTQQHSDSPPFKTIRNHIENALRPLMRFAITATALLPFSSRGIVMNIVKAPFRLIQCLGHSLKEAIQNKSVSSFTSTCSTKFSEYVESDWKGGISDSYTDLCTPENKERAKGIAQENLRYAAYLDNGKFSGFAERGFEDAPGDGLPLSEMDQENLDIAEVKREYPSWIPGLLGNHGFTKTTLPNHNNQEIYYNVKTGVMLSVVLDYTNTETPEIVFCIHGVGTEDAMGVKAKEKKKIATEFYKGIAYDFVGGIPESALQMIELGKLVKEECVKTGYTPVFVGHSHGGALAQYAAASNGLKAVVFNSRPMGAGVRRYIGQDTIAQNAINMTVFSCKDDWLTGSTAINTMGQFMERVVGIPVPRSVGVGYSIPPVESEETSFDYLVTQHNSFYLQMQELLRT